MSELLAPGDEFCKKVLGIASNADKVNGNVEWVW